MLYTKCYHEKLYIEAFAILHRAGRNGISRHELKAQEITFRAAENEEADAIGVKTSDGVPVVADFDNNGFMDLWAPGQTYEWRPTSEVDEKGEVIWTWQWYDDLPPFVQQR